ncbi:MAG: GNAT family N-acetyltransferase [Actinomycetota bacterium]|nr:GNAT family N-acetyltransferase [Actinomycetota bacterium]
MGLDPYPVSPADVADFVRAAAHAFGSVADDEDIAWRTADFFEPGLALAVTDGGRMVATAAAHLFELTLPAAAGRPCPVVTIPGVTAVGVLPTHRRRGLLTKLMAAQLSDFRSRGFPLAVLLASEAVIYRRFGYGPAQSFQSVAIETHRAAFLDPAPAPGSMVVVDREEAGKVLPGLHDRARRLRPAELSRSRQWWDSHLADREKTREGGSGRFYAVHETPSGEADGWVSYRVHMGWNAGLPDGWAEVQDLVAASDAGVGALWRYVLDLDLVAEVRAPQRPLDDPLRWLLADFRRLHTTQLVDHLWVRIVDVVGALAARGYGAEERLVLEVTGADPGRVVLETAGSSGSCRRANRGEKADLVLGLAELGAIYLGGVRPSALAAAGRIREVRAGALTVADQVFVSPVAPFCSLDF